MTFSHHTRQHRCAYQGIVLLVIKAPARAASLPHHAYGGNGKLTMRRSEAFLAVYDAAVHLIMSSVGPGPEHPPSCPFRCSRLHRPVRRSDSYPIACNAPPPLCSGPREEDRQIKRPHSSWFNAVLGSYPDAGQMTPTPPRFPPSPSSSAISFLDASRSQTSQIVDYHPAEPPYTTPEGIRDFRPAPLTYRSNRAIYPKWRAI